MQPTETGKSSKKFRGIQRSAGHHWVNDAVGLIYAFLSRLLAYYYAHLHTLLHTLTIFSRLLQISRKHGPRRLHSKGLIVICARLSSRAIIATLKKENACALG